MAYRQKMGKRASKRSFARTGSMVHKKNITGGGLAMRGGIRL